MTIEEFLAEYVEGYLFHDLENMERIALPEGVRFGAAGYAMLAAMLAGMELLGALVSDKPLAFRKDWKGRAHFNRYWHSYLADRSRRAYQVCGMGSAIRDLVRNGLGHTFVAKSGIVVYKDVSAPHMTIRRNEYGHWELSINAAVLRRDFVDSYSSKYKPNAPGHIMQDRLNEIVADYAREGDTVLEQLANHMPALVTVIGADEFNTETSWPFETLPSVSIGVTHTASVSPTYINPAGSVGMPHPPASHPGGTVSPQTSQK